MCTSKNAPKLDALRTNPIVALTIDTEVHPPKILLIRGRAELDVVEGIPDEYAAVLTKDAAFPKRLGRPEEYAKLAVAIVENPMLNGEVIRLDGALRMPPR